MVNENLAEQPLSNDTASTDTNSVGASVVAGTTSTAISNDNVNGEKQPMATFDSDTKGINLISGVQNNIDTIETDVFDKEIGKTNVKNNKKAGEAINEGSRDFTSKLIPRNPYVSKVADGKVNEKVDTFKWGTTKLEDIIADNTDLIKQGAFNNNLIYDAVLPFETRTKNDGYINLWYDQMETRAINQSTWDKAANGLTAGLANVALNIGRDISYLGGLLYAGATWQNVWDVQKNNAGAAFIDSLVESVDKQLPLYKTHDEQDNPFTVRNIFSSDFVFGTVIKDALPFLASSYIEGLGAGKLVSALSEGFLIKQMGKEAVDLMKAGKLGDAEAALAKRSIFTTLAKQAPREITSVVMNTGEAFMEAGSAYDTAKTQAADSKRAILEKENEFRYANRMELLTKEEIDAEVERDSEKVATDVFRLNFISNMVLLRGTEILLPLVLKPYNNFKKTNFLDNMLSKTKELDDIRLNPKGKPGNFAKGFSAVKQGAKVAMPIAQNALEEVAQSGLQDLYVDGAVDRINGGSVEDISYFEDIINIGKSLLQSPVVNAGSQEWAVEALVGGLVGGFGIVNSIKENISKNANFNASLDTIKQLQNVQRVKGEVIPNGIKDYLAGQKIDAEDIKNLMDAHSLPDDIPFKEANIEAALKPIISNLEKQNNYTASSTLRQFFKPDSAAGAETARAKQLQSSDYEVLKLIGANTNNFSLASTAQAAQAANLFWEYASNNLTGLFKADLKQALEYVPKEANEEVPTNVQNKQDTFEDVDVKKLKQLYDEVNSKYNYLTDEQRKSIYLNTVAQNILNKEIKKAEAERTDNTRKFFSLNNEADKAEAQIEIAKLDKKELAPELVAELEKIAKDKRDEATKLIQTFNKAEVNSMYTENENKELLRNLKTRFAVDTSVLQYRTIIGNINADLEKELVAKFSEDMQRSLINNIKAETRLKKEATKITDILTGVKDYFGNLKDKVSFDLLKSYFKKDPKKDSKNLTSAQINKIKDTIRVDKELLTLYTIEGLFGAEFRDGTIIPKATVIKILSDYLNRMKAPNGVIDGLNINTKENFTVLELVDLFQSNNVPFLNELNKYITPQLLNFKEEDLLLIEQSYLIPFLSALENFRTTNTNFNLIKETYTKLNDIITEKAKENGIEVEHPLFAILGALRNVGYINTILDNTHYIHTEVESKIAITYLNQLISLINDEVANKPKKLITIKNSSEEAQDIILSSMQFGEDEPSLGQQSFTFRAAYRSVFNTTTAVKPLWDLDKSATLVDNNLDSPVQLNVTLLDSGKLKENSNITISATVDSYVDVVNSANANNMDFIANTNITEKNTNSFASIAKLNFITTNEDNKVLGTIPTLNSIAGTIKNLFFNNENYDKWELFGALLSLDARLILDKIPEKYREDLIEFAEKEVIGLIDVEATIVKNEIYLAFLERLSILNKPNFKSTTKVIFKTSGWFLGTAQVQITTEDNDKVEVKKSPRNKKPLSAFLKNKKHAKGAFFVKTANDSRVINSEGKAIDTALDELKDAQGVPINFTGSVFMYNRDFDNNVLTEAPVPLMVFSHDFKSAAENGDAEYIEALNKGLKQYLSVFLGYTDEGKEKFNSIGYSIENARTLINAYFNPSTTTGANDVDKQTVLIAIDSNTGKPYLVVSPLGTDKMYRGEEAIAALDELLVNYNLSLEAKTLNKVPIFKNGEYAVEAIVYDELISNFLYPSRAIGVLEDEYIIKQSFRLVLDRLVNIDEFKSEEPKEEPAKDLDKEVEKSDDDDYSLGSISFNDNTLINGFDNLSVQNAAVNFFASSLIKYFENNSNKRLSTIKKVLTYQINRNIKTIERIIDLLSNPENDARADKLFAEGKLPTRSLEEAKAILARLELLTQPNVFDRIYNLAKLELSNIGFKLAPTKVRTINEDEVNDISEINENDTELDNEEEEEDLNDDTEYEEDSEDLENEDLFEDLNTEVREQAITESKLKLSDKRLIKGTFARLLSTVPKLKNGLPVFNAFGMPVYHSFNDLYNLLRVSLINSSPKFEDMMRTLRNKADIYPELGQIADALEADNNDGFEVVTTIIKEEQDVKDANGIVVNTVVIDKSEVEVRPVKVPRKDKVQIQSQFVVRFTSQEAITYFPLVTKANDDKKQTSPTVKILSSNAANGYRLVLDELDSNIFNIAQDINQKLFSLNASNDIIVNRAELEETKDRLFKIKNVKNKEALSAEETTQINQLLNVLNYLGLPIKLEDLIGSQALGNIIVNRRPYNIKTIVNILIDTLLDEASYPKEPGQAKPEINLSIFNPFVSSQLMFRLAEKIAAKYKYNSTQYLNVNNSKVQTTIQPSYLYFRIQKLLNDSNCLLGNLLSVPGFRNSYLLNMLKSNKDNNEDNSELFELSYLDGFKFNDAGSGVGKLDNVKFLITSLHLYFNSNKGRNVKGGVRTGKFALLTFSDKQTKPIFTAPVFDAIAVNRPVITTQEGVISQASQAEEKLGIFLNKDSALVNNLANTVVDELERMAKYAGIAAQGRADELGISAKEMEGSKLIYSFPGVNRLLREADNGIEIEIDEANNYTFNITEKGRDKIKNIILSSLSQDASARFQELLDFNIISRDENGKLSFNLIDKSIIKPYLVNGFTEEEALKLFLLEFEANSALTNFNVLQALGKSAMQNYKGTVKLDLPFQNPLHDLEYFNKNIIEVSNAITATMDEQGKRLAGILAPGDVNTDIRNKNYIIAKDVKVDWYDKQYKESFGIEGYDNVNLTDAAEMISYPEYLIEQITAGQITDEEFAIAWADVQNKNYEKPDYVYPVYINAIKPVYYNSETNVEEGIVTSKYIKSACFVLTPQLASFNPVFDNLRRIMEGEPGTINEGKYTRVTFASAVKEGGSNIVDLFQEKDGRITGINTGNITTQNIHSLAAEGYLIQQQIPVKQDKGKVSIITQLTKSLFANLQGQSLSVKTNLTTSVGNIYIEEMSVASMERHFDDVRSLQLKGRYDKFLNKLKFDYNLNSQREINEKIQQLLVEEGVSRGMNLSELEQFTLNEDGDFELPLEYGDNSKKISSLLLSVINNVIVKQKVNGKSYVQFPGDLFLPKTVKEMEASGITWVKNKEGNYLFNPEKGLQYTREEVTIDENKERSTKLGYTQVILPFDMYDHNGKRIKLKEFAVKDANGKMYIDLKYFPKELLANIAGRIPNQGASSTTLVEIVGFLPPGYVNIAFIGGQVTGQMGADFDADKLTTYKTPFVTYRNDKGRKKILMIPDLNPTLPLNESILEDEAAAFEAICISKGIKITREQVKDLILQKAFDNVFTMTAGSREFIEESLKPLDKTAISKVAEQNKKRKNKVKANNPYGYGYQQRLFSANKDGQVGVGFFSAAFISSSVYLNKNLSFGRGIALPILVKGGGIKIKNVTSLSDPGKNINGESKVYLLGDAQSQAVDNAKNQLLGFLNMNEDTFSYYINLSMLSAVDKDNPDEENLTTVEYISSLLTQPIVVELLDYISSNKLAQYVNKNELMVKFLISKIGQDFYNQFQDELNESNFRHFVVYPQDLAKLATWDLKQQPSNVDKPAYFKIMFNVVKLLQEVDSKTTGILGANTLVNLDSRGAKGGLLATNFKLNEATKATEQINNFDNFLSNTVYGMFVSSIQKGINKFSSVMRSADQTYLSKLEEILRNLNISVTARNIENLHKQITNYDIINSLKEAAKDPSNNFDLNNLMNLMLDPTSNLNAVKIFNDLKNKHPNNLFLRQFTVAKYLFKGINREVVKRKPNVEEQGNDILEIQKDFLELYNNPTYKAYMKGFVFYNRYLYPSNNLGSLSRFIPLQILKELKITGALRKTYNNFNSELAATNYVANNKNIFMLKLLPTFENSNNSNLFQAQKTLENSIKTYVDILVGNITLREDGQGATRKQNADNADLTFYEGANNTQLSFSFEMDYNPDNQSLPEYITFPINGDAKGFYRLVPTLPENALDNLKSRKAYNVVGTAEENAEEKLGKITVQALFIPFIGSNKNSLVETLENSSSFVFTTGKPSDALNIYLDYFTKPQEESQEVEQIILPENNLPIGTPIVVNTNPFSQIGEHSLERITNALENESASNQYAGLALTLAQLLDEDVTIVTQNQFDNTLGQYRKEKGKKTISLGVTANKQGRLGVPFTKVLSHELIHAITADHIHKFFKNPAELKATNREVYDAIEKLMELYNFSKEALIKNKSQLYNYIFNQDEFTGLNEFLAHLMTDNDFQTMLNNIQAPATFKSSKNVFTAFIDSIIDLVTAIFKGKLNKDSVLSKALIESAILLSPDTKSKTSDTMDIKLNSISFSKANKTIESSVKEIKDDKIRAKVNNLYNAYKKARQLASNPKIGPDKQTFEDQADFLLEGIQEYLSLINSQQSGTTITQQNKALFNLAENQLNAIIARISNNNNLMMNSQEILFAMQQVKLWQDALSLFDITETKKILEVNTKLYIISSQLEDIMLKSFTEELNNAVPFDELKIKDPNDLKQQTPINTWTAFTLDLSQTKNELLTALDLILKNAARDAGSEYNDKYLTSNNELLKALEAAGFDLKDQKLWDKFMQVDDKGDNTGLLVTKFNSKFYKELRAQIDKITLAGKPLFAYRKTVDWLRQNVHTINPSYIPNNDLALRQIELDALLAEGYTDREAEKYLQEAEQKYKSFLIRTRNYGEFQKNKLYIDENSVDAAGNLIPYTDANGNAYNEPQNVKLYREKIRKFGVFNDPIKVASNINSKVPHGSLSYKKLDFVAFVPSKKSANYNSYLDNKFTEIQNNEALRNYYEFAMDNLIKYRKLLPNHMLIGLPNNYLPETMKTLYEDIIKNGGLKGIGVSIMKPFVETFAAHNWLSKTESSEQNVYDAQGNRQREVPVVGLQYKQKQLASKVRSQTKLVAALGKVKIGDKVKIRKVDKVVTAELLALEQRRLALMQEELDNFLKVKSFSLPDIMNNFVLTALNYKHKTSVEPLVLLGKEILERSDAPVLNADGTPKIQKNTIISNNESLKNAIAMLDYSINAILYNERKEDEIALKDREFKINSDGLIDVYNKEFKRMKTREKELEEQSKTTPLTDKELNELENIKLELEYTNTGTLTVSRILDMVIKLQQLKSLGANPFQASADFTSTLVQSTILAAGGENFTTKHLASAFGLMLNSTKNLLIKNSTAKKITNLMNKFNLVGELIEGNYGTSQTIIKAQWGVDPYALLKTSNFFNVGLLMVANLKSKTVMINGVETTLWDAFNEEGNFKDDTNKDWVGSFDDNAELIAYKKLRNSMLQQIKIATGNSDVNSPVMAKKYIIGRLLGQFRLSWIPTGIASRFQTRKFDAQQGFEVEGRYVTLLSVLGKKRTRNYTNLINVALGRKGRTNLTQLEYSNMRKNFAELYWALTVFAGMTLLKNAAEDDDDGEKNYVAIALYNQLNRTMGDIKFYVSPQTAEAIIKNPIPAIKVYKDAANALSGVYNYMFDVEGGYNYDEEYLTRKVLSPFPYVNLYPKTKSQYEEIIEQ